MKNKYKLIGLSHSILALCMANYTALATSSAADLLKWIDDPRANNICKGYFESPSELSAIKHPPKPTETTTSITASDTVTFSQHNTSSLKGNITISQPGRLIKANEAWIYRDNQSHMITTIDLQGNVHYYETNGHIAGQRARIHLQNQCTQLYCGAYQFPENRWGTTDLAVRDCQGNLHLEKATYSTCPPNKTTWKLVSHKLDIDKVNGVGYAKGAQFRLSNVPIMYIPSLSFPIDHRRKSGFLFPTISYSNDDGLELLIPYYFNLAPNYDATVSARVMTERGVQVNVRPRYLTKNSRGNAYVSYLPHDAKFADFKENAIEKYDGDPIRQPFLSRIDNADTYRALIHLDHATYWQPHWHADVIFNWVSDDYYLQDFGNNPVLSNTDQLISLAQLLYQDANWHVFGRAEVYQTLHPLDTLSPEPYNRVPQIHAESYFINKLFGLDYSLYSDFTHFDHRRNFVTNSAVVTGERLHIRPGAALSFHEPYAFLEAKGQLDVRGYWLHHSPSDEPDQLSSLIPIFSVDSGLFFDRCTKNYLQTLEPRAYYLYIPKSNQNDIPLFDTTLPPVNFEQMFYHNRFAGADRLGDAHQLAFALRSRFLNPYTHEQKLSAHLGTILYFTDRNVCLTPDCQEDPPRDYLLSPIIAGLNIQLTPTWSFDGHIGWDPRNYKTDTATAKIHFQPYLDAVMNAGYEFVRNGDGAAGAKNNNLSRLDLSVAWPITSKVSVLGDWNYNLSHSHPQSYFAGLSYDSCCWAIRAIASRTTLDTDLNDNAKFDTKYYLQIKFKGLGTVANSDPHALLTDGIEGFYDHF